MRRSKRVKNEATGAGRASCVTAGTLLIISWSCPAFPDEQPHLRLAPIELRTTAGGNIAYTFQRNTFGKDKSIQQELDLGVNAGIMARTFIWQPWLARVTGMLQVATGTNTTQGTTIPTNRSGNTFITGNGNLQVLLHSRFPFTGHVYRSLNETNGFLSNINSNYVNTGIDLLQKYRSKDGKLDSSAAFSRAMGGRANFSTEDISNQLNIDLRSEPFRYQTVRLAGSAGNTNHPIKGERSFQNSLVGDHTYEPNPELSVASFLNLIKTSFTLPPPAAIPLQQDYNSQQLSSVAAWRPEGSPLTVTGSARIFRTNSSSNGVVTPTVNDTNLNLGANYAWSPLLRMYGSVNVNDNNGFQSITTNANLSAQRGFGDKNVSDIGGFRYSRSAGASLSNTTTTTTASDQTTTTTSVQSLGGSLGHDLSKTTQLGSGNLNMAAHQSLTAVISSATSPATQLNTGGSLGWQSTDNHGTTVMRLQANDSHRLSNPTRFFQMINLQAYRTEQVGRDQSLTGSLTLGGSRSGDRKLTTPFVATPSADLHYTHNRLFKVKHLDFDSSLSIQGAQIMSSRDSNQLDSASATWNNNLYYFIGRLKMQLHMGVQEVHNTTQSSILFTMNRTF
jgi:hypothetical protein